MSFYAKIVIALIVIGIIGAVGYDLKTSHEKIGVLEATVSTQADTIKTMKQDKKLNQKADGILEDAGAAVAEKTNDSKDANVKIRTEVDKQVSAIREKYRKALADAEKKNPGSTATPPVDKEVEDLRLMEETEIAGAHFDGLQKAYCRVKPKDSQCNAAASPVPVPTV